LILPHLFLFETQTEPPMKITAVKLYVLEAAGQLSWGAL